MFSFNPSIIILDLKKEPVPLGEIEDGKLRAEEMKIRTEIARCSHKDATQADASSVPELREKLRTFILKNCPKMTLGDATTAALGGGLRKNQDDPNSMENRSETDRIKHMKWAMKILDAQDRGVIVIFDDDHMKTIRDRVSRYYFNPAIIWRLDEAIKEVEPPTAIVDMTPVQVEQK